MARAIAGTIVEERLPSISAIEKITSPSGKRGRLLELDLSNSLKADTRFPQRVSAPNRKAVFRFQPSARTNPKLQHAQRLARVKQAASSRLSSGFEHRSSHQCPSRAQGPV